MLLDICKAITLRWELNETMPKRKSCTSRDGAWPIESDMFEYRFYNQLEYMTSSSCELYISKRRLGASLTQTLRLHILLSIRLSVWQSISYCFISGAVSLNSRRKDVKIGSSSHSRLRRARLLKLLLLQGCRRRYISRATSFTFTNSGRNSVKLIFM